MKSTLSPLKIKYKKPLNFTTENQEFKIFENIPDDNYEEPKVNV